MDEATLYLLKHLMQALVHSMASISWSQALRAASCEGGWEGTGMDDKAEWAVVGAKKDEGMDEEAASRAGGRGMGLVRLAAPNICSSCLSESKSPSSAARIEASSWSRSGQAVSVAGRTCPGSSF